MLRAQRRRGSIALMRIVDDLQAHVGVILGKDWEQRAFFLNSFAILKLDLGNIL